MSTVWIWKGQDESFSFWNLSELLQTSKKLSTMGKKCFKKPFSSYLFRMHPYLKTSEEITLMPLKPLELVFRKLLYVKVLLEHTHVWKTQY